MRRVSTLAAAFAAVAAATLPALAYAQVGVPTNQVRRLSFSGSAADVVVGNPDIAEVTVVDGRNVFVTGRREGVTSVVVLDAAGRIIFNDRVAVGRGGGGSGAGVTVARAASVTTVVCDPRCEDSPAGSATTGGAGAAAGSPVNALRALLPQSGAPPAAAQSAVPAPATVAPSASGSSG